MKKQNLSELLIYILSAELVGLVSAFLAGSYSDFFQTYQAPPLQPPAWLFPIVWVILYAVMGTSAYLIHSSGAEPSRKEKALTVYWSQLAVNFSWSIVFFRFKWLWGGFFVILVLLALIFLMIKMFRDIRPVAGYINIPYACWVVFAGYLTLAIAIIN